jgi:ketosteroid isomerase-like protein
VHRRALAIATLALAACAPTARAPSAADRAAVTAAFDHYIAMLKFVNSDSVAAMYADNAELYQPNMAPLVGRAAIRGFLAPFDGHAHVDSASGTITALDLHGDVAVIWATYHQVARIDTGTANTFDGRFVSQWERSADGRWRIRRFLTQPVSHR